MVQSWLRSSIFSCARLTITIKFDQLISLSLYYNLKIELSSTKDFMKIFNNTIKFLMLCIISYNAQGMEQSAETPQSFATQSLAPFLQKRPVPPLSTLFEHAVADAIKNKKNP